MIDKLSSPGKVPSSPAGGGLRTWLLGLCPLVGLLAASVLLLFGVTTWTLLALALLVACPLVVGWILLIERR